MRLSRILKSIVPVKQKEFLKILLYRASLFSFDYRIDKDLDILKKKINLYFLFFPSKRKNFINEINFINKLRDRNNYSFIFPYSFLYDYDYNSVKVYKDIIKDLYYVIHKGKRLYYSRFCQSEIAVKRMYNNISIEQDERSPHCYLNDSFDVDENDVVADIGAAEGNFSLDVVEKVSALYIFETRPEWIEALNATFEPWKEKVHIINKFVSNINNDKCIILDSILGDNKPVNFIKMDVEGAEILVLKGLEKNLNNNTSLKMAICTYHRKNDFKEIGEILSNYRFKCKYSNGYMLFVFSKLTPPYFRRGLIKAYRIKSNE